MHVARGVAPGLWGSHASGGSEIESILQNRQSTVLPFVMYSDKIPANVDACGQNATASECDSTYIDFPSFNWEKIAFADSLQPTHCGDRVRRAVIYDKARGMSYPHPLTSCHQ